MKSFLAVIMVVALAPTAAGAAQWTAATIKADQPFGTLDTSGAGRDFKSFWRGLSRQQRTEIRARCSVIGNSDRYRTEARALCSELKAEDTFDGAGSSSGSGGHDGNAGASTAGGGE